MEQRRLDGNVAELADTVGATVWTPPTGGAAELLDDGHDLRAVDRTGAPGEWRCHRPARCTGEPAFRSGPDGRLVPTGSAEALTIHTARPPSPLERAPVPVAVHPSTSPAVVVERRRAPTLGVPWLHPGQSVNADAFEVFVASHRNPRRVAEDGLPSPDLFLVGRLDPRPLQPIDTATYLLQIRVEPGGAIPLTSMQAHVPARLQHRLGVNGGYLLPAGRFDRLRLLAGYRLGEAGQLSADGEFDDAPVRLDCAGAWHGVAGLPNDVSRWPESRSGSAYALVPTRGTGPPRGWLRLYPRAPRLTEGHVLLEVHVPAGRAIDVPATAEALARLPAVRSRAEQLRSAGIGLIAPSRSYGRLSVHRVFDASHSSWSWRRGIAGGPLSTVLPALRAAARLPDCRPAPPERDHGGDSVPCHP